MATRNISLTQQLDAFVEDRVNSGAYQNASEVVRAGLRSLRQIEQEQAAKIERLRAAIQVGLDDIARGDIVEVDDVEAWLNGLGRGSDI